MSGPGSLLLHLLAALAAALVGAFVAHRARQSILAGFLLAGVALRPWMPAPSGSAEIIRELAELGIVFLMFAVGVQLPVRDLARRGPRLVGLALAQVTLTILLGIGIGRAIGWSPLESFAFGAVLSNSSSTVLARLVQERGETEHEWGRTALAWSSVQDLSTIVLVAALALLTRAPGDTGASVAASLGGTLLYLFVIVPCALWLLPKLLALAASLRNREIFLLSVTVTALAMSWGAAELGVSLALGAFVAGVVVGESDLSHRVLSEVAPLRDLFAGLFFVSIGMLFDPSFVVSHAGLVLATGAAIVFGKGLLTLALTHALGTARHVAWLVALGLAQSGEFSFLLAHIGAQRGALSSEVFHVAVAGTILSILASPYVLATGARLQRTLRPDDGALDGEPTDADRHDHVVVCGHGRVGAVACRMLERHGVRYVVIEDDMRIVRALRQRDVAAIFGDACRPEILRRAGLARARALLVCVSDPLAAHCTVEHARAAHPQLAIFARTHTERERRALQHAGATEALFTERELGVSLGARALHEAGLPEGSIAEEVERARRDADEPIERSKPARGDRGDDDTQTGRGPFGRRRPSFR